MATQLKVIGREHIGKIEFTGIEGGFGKDKKAMLVKDIAKIHDRPSYKVNELINNNAKRFKQGVDLLDLKSVILPKDKDVPQWLYSGKGLLAVKSALQRK